MILSKLEYGTRVSFDVYPKVYITSDFNNVKVLGIFDYITAMSSGLDVIALSNLVVNTIPTPVNFKDDWYVKVELANGNTEIVAVSWIDEPTLQQSNLQSVTIDIQGVTASDIEIILNAISAHGYTPDEVKIT